MTEFNIDDGVRLQKISINRNLAKIINNIPKCDGQEIDHFSGFKHMLEFETAGVVNA